MFFVVVVVVVVLFLIKCSFYSLYNNYVDLFITFVQCVLFSCWGAHLEALTSCVLILIGEINSINQSINQSKRERHGKTASQSVCRDIALCYPVLVT